MFCMPLVLCHLEVIEESFLVAGLKCDMQMHLHVVSLCASDNPVCFGGLEVDLPTLLAGFIYVYGTSRHATGTLVKLVLLRTKFSLNLVCMRT